MTQETILASIQEIIHDCLGIDKEEIIPSAHFMNDLGSDSISLSEIILRIEDEFDIRIKDDELEKIKTVGDVADAIVLKLNVTQHH